MKREQLEKHKITIDGWHARLGDLASESGDGRYNVIADAVSDLAGIVGEMVGDALAFQAHVEKLAQAQERMPVERSGAEGPFQPANFPSEGRPIMRPGPRVEPDARD
jgi:hypothetical protein